MRHLWFILLFFLISCGGRPHLPANIIIIMADDLGWGDVSCFEGNDFETPNIDQLAMEGVKCTDYHTNSATCSPTRAALMTGRYQQRCGIEGVLSADKHRSMGLSLDEFTLAELLDEQGYATAIFGKWHLGYNTDLTPPFQGFDSFVGFVSGNIDYFSHIDQAGYPDWWHNEFISMQEKGYSTHLITEHSLAFLEAHKNEPIFMYVAHQAPHYPYQGPEDNAFRRAGRPGEPAGPRRDKKAAYAEMIAELDASVGQIVAKLKELKLDKDTFIFFCSDNGPTGPGKAGQLRGGKGQLWEGGIRVPAIAWWPEKITNGIENSQTFLSMDLFPTIASITGILCPDNLDGIDVSSTFFSDTTLADRPMFWRLGDSKAVRLGEWKWIEQGDTRGLYNLYDDLQEANDLSMQNPEKVDELSTLLVAWEAEMDTLTYLSK